MESVTGWLVLAALIGLGAYFGAKAFVKIRDKFRK